MIKQLTSKRNLNEAYSGVYRNKGAAGIDGIQVTELHSTLKTHGKPIRKEKRENINSL